MPRFSTVFQLSNEQATLDFVDVELSTDTRLYLDPYAIEIRDDEWSSLCGDHIRSFFNDVLAALRDGNEARAFQLLSHLREPNETYLGQSTGAPQGRGVGDFKARQFVRALRNSRAFETGVLADMSEAELFIEGIGPDTISDLTTNILRGLLAEYTKQQCELHNVLTYPVNSIGPSWNAARLRWESRTYDLPKHRSRPILLVPKVAVRHRMSLDSQEFYNHHMIEFLRQEYLQSGSALIHTFKNGRQDVFKSSVKEIHPLIKDDLADFVRRHPDVLEEYKQIKGAQGPITPGDLEKFFDEQAFAQVLIDRLRATPQGSADATAYHELAIGICTFLFHPSLISPIREHEIHQGRKRIDIKFTNAATGGFFFAMLESNQARALSVFVECKNYTKEMNNPELDQLAGRFGHQRGRFGMLLCRQMDNRQRIIERCRDTASDNRGLMLVLEDRDLIQMLTMVAQGRRRSVDALLRERFSEITN